MIIRNLILSLVCATGLRAATSLSIYGGTFAIEWVEDLAVGQYVTGDYYIVAPAGVTITSITPASTVESGRTINGAMINPSAGEAAKQGFDSNAEAANMTLNVARPGGADLSPANPLVVPPGSSLLLSKSLATPNLRPQLSDGAIVTVVAAAPPAGSFRPPPTGSDKAHYWQESALNYGILRSLPAVANAPNLATVTAAFSRPWFEFITGVSGRDTHPSNNQPDYGRDIANQLGEAFGLLHLDYTNEQKRDLFVRIVQFGIDVYGSAVAGGRWRDLGGHNQGRKMPLILAGLAFNDPNILAYANAANFFHFQEDRQTFFVTQDDIDRGHPAHAHCAAYANVTDRAHMPAVCNRYCLGGNPGDNRQRDVYTSEMLGLPEWGEQHTSQAIRDGSNWGVAYRSIVFNSMWQHVLCAQLIPGAREAWNHPALFDFMDRARAVESGPGGELSAFEWNMWTAYRSLGGPIWSATTVAPTITSQPGNRGIAAGASTTFTVGASGTPSPTYQWRKGGVNLINGGRISGATTATLSITAAEIVDAGNYDCVVSNTAGFVISDSAFLEVSSVEPPPPTTATPGRRRDRGQRLLVTP